MSQYTSEYLHDNVRVGYTDKRGPAWWNRSGVTSTGEPNHFPGPVPVNVARELLTSDPAIAVPVRITVPEYLGPDGVTDKRHLTVPDRIAVVGARTGNVFGMFRDSYTIHDLDGVLLDDVADVIGESRGDLSIGSVGLLKYGAVGWLQLESPENLTTSNGVEFRPHLLATTSHDGTLATTYTRCSTVVVCDNTYTAAMGERGDRVKVKHSKHSALHLGTAREALGILADTGAEFAAEVEALSKVKVSAAAFSRFVTAWAPMPEDAEKNKRAVTVAENKRATLTGLYKEDPRVAPWKGSGWGVVQAVNTYGIHYAALRNGVKDDEKRNAAERFDRATLAAADGTMGQALANTRDLLTSVL
jgi:phage/plasmid-like protein (TIGR03299 family)